MKRFLSLTRRSWRSNLVREDGRVGAADIKVRGTDIKVRFGTVKPDTVKSREGLITNMLRHPAETAPFLIHIIWAELAVLWCSSSCWRHYVSHRSFS